MGEKCSSTVTVTFELKVMGEPSPATRFFGGIAQGQMLEAEVQLIDPDGDAVYTGSMSVERGAERGVGIVERDGRSDLIKDFGLVKFDRDRTLSADVSFE